MPLGWNEIRSRAVAFSSDWAGETREHAESKSFWDDFFRVFGLTRRHTASFEEPVRGLSGHFGFIDLFWKGVLLAEHKSRGQSLSKAATQANDYVQSLIREGRGDEVPRYIIVSDFATIVLHDLENDTELRVPLGELHQHVHSFAFIPGYRQHSLEPEDPINIKAVQIMGDLHDALEAGGYTGDELERLLVRILFCLFAEDTGILERSMFQLYIENHTREDGSDLGGTLAQIFLILNTPVDRRQSGLPEELAAIPYVNGDLFADFLGFPVFNRDMRNSLLSCCRFDWSRISPAVFGALFQSVMEHAERRQVGAHYTSERDILKVIGPLFVDNLKAELSRAGKDPRKLRALHKKLEGIKVLDPACGCGNFLVVSYRELRLIELEIIVRLRELERQVQRDKSYSDRYQVVHDLEYLAKVDVDQMYGIEIGEWPARIAEVAMWLMDHQMNLRFSEAIGEYFVRLPLVASPHIINENALTIDWGSVLDPSECSYVLGNPPFVGSRYQSDEQRLELRAVFGEDIRGVGILDYVTAWYRKAVEYISGTEITVAFVSTNSVTQGEQVSVLWGELLRFGLKIHFAHRTFAWQSEARGSAHVHVVIIGFGLTSPRRRCIFDYEDIRGNPTEVRASNINPYLVDGNNALVSNRSRPLSAEIAMVSGNQPIDGGFYLFTPDEKSEFVSAEPKSEKFFKIWLGGREFLNGIERWCLFLRGAEPSEIRRLPKVLERIEAVREYRSRSRRASTVRLADSPTAYQVEIDTGAHYLAMPEVSSERRTYIPVAFLTADVVCGNKLRLVPSGGLWEFGILMSSMHMAWVRGVSGRLKSDFQYSIKLVYNNFPWPPNVTDRQREAVKTAAQAVLDARDQYHDSTLADLYDPLSMPAPLVRAHANLDRAVDRCYRSQPFPHERNRVEYLFEQYERLNAPLVARNEKRVRRK